MAVPKSASRKYWSHQAKLHPFPQRESPTGTLLKAATSTAYGLPRTKSGMYFRVSSIIQFL